MRFSTTAWMLAAAQLLWIAPARAGELEARLDRSSVGAGETLQLLLRHRGSSREPPDLTPLEADFEVLDVSRSHRTTVVNGQRDASVDWLVRLAPRRSGQIEIPVLRAGAAESQPLRLEVASARPSPTPGGAPGAASPVLVEVEVDAAEPYVQSKVLLTVRVLAGPEVIDGALADPVVEGAVVERVGEDRHGRRDVAGVSHRLIERQYAVFPQRSGELEISPLVFEGRVRAAAARRPRDPVADFFGSSGIGGFGSSFDDFFAALPSRDLFEGFFGPTGQAIRAHSEAVVLDVRGRPEQAEGDWWIPARQLELVEEWEDGPPAFRVGEPVTRVVAIRATGLSGAQLPELALSEVEGLKQYAEPAVDDTFALDDDVVAVKAQRVALIPTRSGELILPELELAWWDTAADVPRVARLPARSVWVSPGRDDGAADLVGPAVPPVPTGPSSPPLGGLAAVGILLGCVAAGWAARRRCGRPPGTTGKAPSLRAAERALDRACAAGDPATAAAALRRIARARDPEGSPRNAAARAGRPGSPELERAVAELDRVQYSPDAGRWDGSALWRAYRGAVRCARRSSGGPGGPLPALYPTR